MQSKSYGDKQRETQQRKKQDELRKKSNPGTPPAPEAPPPQEDAEDKAAKKVKTKKTPKPSPA